MLKLRFSKIGRVKGIKINYYKEYDSIIEFTMRCLRYLNPQVPLFQISLLYILEDRKIIVSLWRRILKNSNWIKWPSNWERNFKICLHFSWNHMMVFFVLYVMQIVSHISIWKITKYICRDNIVINWWKMYCHFKCISELIFLNYSIWFLDFSILVLLIIFSLLIYFHLKYFLKPIKKPWNPFNLVSKIMNKMEFSLVHLSVLNLTLFLLIHFFTLISTNLQLMQLRFMKK